MLLVGNGTVITRDSSRPLIQDGCVAICNNLILEVGQTAEMLQTYPQAEFLDADGKIIHPGLINSHMHFYSTFARGMALKDPAPGNFREILERLWWRLDRSLTLEDVYYSSLIPIIDCIKNGTTTVFDHHASAHCIEGSLFKIADACRQAGLRACLCYEVSDRDGAALAEAGIAENMNFIKYCREAGDPMLQAMFGLHASMTLSSRTLAACVRENAGSGAGFHFHAAEGIEDLADARKQYGIGVIERLNAARVLGEKSIAAHCIHVSREEIGILAKTGTLVSHNPESNMSNAVGAAPVRNLFYQNVKVGLGTDGYTCDLFESLKVANCLMKHESRDPAAGWLEGPAMLFEHNRSIAGQYFPKPLGCLMPGACADLIILDYRPPTPLESPNIDSHLLYGVCGRAVETTVINGRIIMKNRQLMTLDESEICARSKEMAKRLWERF